MCNWKLINDCLISVKGEFSEGLMHGTGKYMWADGVVYEVFLNSFTRNVCIIIKLHRYA